MGFHRMYVEVVSVGPSKFILSTISGFPTLLRAYDMACPNAVFLELTAIVLKEGSALPASFPGSCAVEEEREPGTHCLRMCQVPLVTCILLRYSKITINFCSPAERLHFMVILPVGHIRAVLKSNTISL